MTIKQDNWNWFQQNRSIPENHKTITCYAPFNHMRIRRDGGMSPCCFSARQQQWELGKVGLKDFWFDGLNIDYQNSLMSNQLHVGCITCCGNRIKNKIIPPITEYDWNVGDERLEHALDGSSWPKVFEFEISNLCNFACPMCMGELSSKHMLGRDKDLKTYKPNIFDDDKNLNALLEEMKEFIPHLEQIRFVGGEPFAHKALYKICDLIKDLNPDLSVQVCTNGSVFNKKVKKICETVNLQLSISIDTVMPQEYKQIRIGGEYNQTFENIDSFKKFIGPEKIMVNTTFMIINAYNIDNFFEYARDNEFDAFVNIYDREGREHTVDWSVKNLPVNEKNDIIKKLTNLYDIYPTEIKKCIEQLNQ